MTTEPPTRSNESFHTCIKILLKTAANISPENDERRTHCMNVLRAVYRDSQLGEIVISYVAEGVMVAVTGFKSSVWGVSVSKGIKKKLFKVFV